MDSPPKFCWTAIELRFREPTGCETTLDDDDMALPMQLFAPMRCRLRVMIGAIVILSASAVMADFSDDFRTVNEVDRNAAIRVRDRIEVHSLDGSLTPAQLDAFADLAEKGAVDIARFTGV